MASSNQFQPITVKPMVGKFDAQSSIDTAEPGSFCWKMNFAINPSDDLARAYGWIRAFNGPCFTNGDYHIKAVDEPTTLLFSSVDSERIRRLFIATKTRILLLDQTTNDYTLLGSGFGADGLANLTQLRFHAAELQDKVLFTNNFDLVQLYDIVTKVLAPIPSLEHVDVSDVEVPLTKSLVTISWQGLMFLMNNEEGGTRFASRVRWSDANDPTWWEVADNPNTGAKSVADFSDLDYQEAILAALPLGSYLYIYTDQSIWRCQMVQGATSDKITLNAQKIYTDPRNRSRCLAYPNTLISTGQSHFYLASDGWYEINQYLAQPERTPWANLAAFPLLFKYANTQIDKQACQSPVAEYTPGITEDGQAAMGEIHLSWPTYQADSSVVPPACATGRPAGLGVNNYTLVFNVRLQTADVRDCGVTSMVNFTPDATVEGLCNQQAQLIACNGVDWCLKQMNTGQSRQMWNGTAYVDTGYYSVWRMVLPLFNFQDEKEINQILLDLVAVDENDPAVARMRVGISNSAVDPNLEDISCSVLWRQLSSKSIKCLRTRTAAQYVADGIRPNPPRIIWPFISRERFIILELTIAAADGSAPTTGANTQSRLEVMARIV